MVAGWVHQELTTRLGPGVETGGYEQGCSVKKSPRFPTFILETERGSVGAEPDHVQAKSMGEVQLDFAQHLVKLNNFDWRAGRVQSECLTQLVDRRNMHPGDR
jgi:hypothetical protein